MTIFEELRELTGQHHHLEPPAAYLTRLAVAASALPESSWVKLTSDAAEWVNAAVVKVNAGELVQSCPGWPEATDDPPAAPAPVPVLVHSSSDVEKAEEGAADKWNLTDAIREVVMLHPDWNQVQVKGEMDRIAGKPVNLGTIATVRSVTLATIAAAKRLGMWRAA